MGERRFTVKRTKKWILGIMGVAAMGIFSLFGKSAVTATADSVDGYAALDAAAGLAHVVDLSTTIENTIFGGVGVTHTGTVGANATLLTQLDVAWEPTAIPENSIIDTAGGERQVVTKMPGIFKYMLFSVIGVTVLAIIAAIYCAVTPPSRRRRRR